jgi:hypothetical protein
VGCGHHPKILPGSRHGLSEGLREVKFLTTEGTETTEPKIKSSKQKGFQNPPSSLSTVYGGEGRVRGSESRKRLNKI